MAQQKWSGAGVLSTDYGTRTALQPRVLVFRTLWKEMKFDA
jgi:hypothetical protein